MNTDITVCISIYGSYDVRRLKASIMSLLKQDPQPNIIVSEQNTGPSDFADIPSVDHIFVQHTEEKYNPGEVRNRALKNSSTKYLYLTDADLLFPNRTYLQDLSVRSEDQTLIHPPMRRIILPAAEKFLNEMDRNGDVAEEMKRLKTDREYIAYYDSPPELKIIDRQRKYTIDVKTFEKYKKSSELKGFEPTIFYDVSHIGGIFSTKEKLESVGGYSDAYLTWGYEDTDLQAKLATVGSVIPIPRERKFEVWHLDHDKSYFDPIQGKANEEKFSHRSKNINQAIQEDLCNYLNG